METKEIAMYDNNGLIIGVIIQRWVIQSNDISILDKEVRLTFEELDLIKNSESIYFN